MRRDEWLQVWLGRHDRVIQRHGRSPGNCPWRHFSSQLLDQLGLPAW